MSLGQKPLAPLRTWLPKGNGAGFGVHTFNVIGSGIFANLTRPATGNPTGVNSGGVPEVTATYVATGIYSLRFPPTHAVDISAHVASSSGYLFHAQVNNQGGPSGSAQLEITRLPPAGAASGVASSPLQMSGFPGYLPTGSKVMLSFFAAPTSDGLTSY